MKSIEEEIQQKKFRNSYHKVQLNILYTAGWLNALQSKVFKQYDISIQQYNVLRILKGSMPKACNLMTIKSKMLDRMSDTSRIIDRLTQNGLVVATQCPDDRRKLEILITEEGIALLDKMSIAIQEMDEFSTGLSLEEAEQLSLLLDKHRSLLKQ